MNRNFENRKPTKVYAKSKENQMIIKALNMYGRVPEQYELVEEIERLNNIIEIMENYFELILDLGFDYDGFNDEDNLKKLIDELCRYASLGRVYNTTETIYVNKDKKYNILGEELKGSDSNE